MKKLVYAAALLLTGLINAQIAVSTNGGGIENGQQFTFSEFTEVPFIVTNLDPDNDIFVRVRVDQADNPATNLQLCFGICLYNVYVGMLVPPTYSVWIPAGESTGAGDHFNQLGPGANPDAQSNYTFTFIQTDEEGNYLADLITWYYRYDPQLGIQENELVKAGVRNMNTKVSDAIVMDLTENLTLQLFDINGRSVRQLPLEAGQQRVDVSDLASGVYIAQFGNGKAMAQVKILKN